MIGDQLVNTSDFLNDDEKNSAVLEYTVLPTGVELGTNLNRDKVRDPTRGGKKEQELREKIAQLPGSDLSGFMPLREDFEYEYENNAEQVLADMEFSPDDHPSEISLKNQVIRIYNQKLDERDRRKRFVIDNGLVDVKKIQLVIC